MDGQQYEMYDSDHAWRHHKVINSHYRVLRPSDKHVKECQSGYNCKNHCVQC